jgi:sterol desaturase/sphingolipid hydroxylase (fatty acid hydroxylase superfamily)
MKHFFSRGFDHPFMPTVLYLFLGISISSLSIYFHPRPFLSILFLFLSGLFSWTLLEYALHRFIFHLTVHTEPWKSLLAAAHMEHHRIAHTQEFILVRPSFSLVSALLVYGIFCLLAQSFASAAILETGLFVGYLFYEWIHYAAHCYHPSSRIGKFLKQYHLHHHFKDESKSFGVTSPLWDLVFKTSPTHFSKA